MFSLGYLFAKLIYTLNLFFNISVFSSFDPYEMPISPIIIIFELPYEELKENYNDSMTMEWHTLVQTHPKYPALDVIDNVIKKYNQ